MLKGYQAPVVPTSTPTVTPTVTITPTATPTPTAVVDLSGTRLDVPVQADAGEVVELRLDVPNRATAGVLLDVRFILPEGIEPLEWVASDGELSYDPLVSTVYWAVELPPQAGAEMQLQVQLNRRGSYRWRVEMQDGDGGVFRREAVTLVPFRLYLPLTGR